MGMDGWWRKDKNRRDKIKGKSGLAEVGDGLKRKERRAWVVDGGKDGK